MNLRKLLLSLLCFLLLCVVSFAQAEQVPAHADGYVNDYAHMLTYQQIQNLDAQLSEFDKNTSNQVVVATFNEPHGDSLEDFSLDLATKWKIGSKENDNGVLMLIIKSQHTMRIEVGYGLEDSLTDALSGIIIRHEITPEFKRGDYYQGISNGVNSIIAATKGEYKAKISFIDKYKLLRFLVDNWAVALFLLIFVMHWVYYLQLKFNKNYVGTSSRHPILFFLFGGGNGGGGGFFGGGGGGGFFGGGGGFGGGGSSGGW